MQNTVVAEHIYCIPTEDEGMMQHLMALANSHVFMTETPPSIIHANTPRTHTRTHTHRFYATLPRLPRSRGKAGLPVTLSTSFFSRTMLLAAASTASDRWRG